VLCYWLTCFICITLRDGKHQTNISAVLTVFLGYSGHFDITGYLWLLNMGEYERKDLIRFEIAVPMFFWIQTNCVPIQPVRAPQWKPVPAEKNVQRSRYCNGLSKVSGFFKWDIIRRCRTNSRIVRLQDRVRRPLCSRPSFIASPLRPLPYLSVRTEYCELNRELNTPSRTEVSCDWICERKDALCLHQTIHRLYLRRPEVSVVVFCIYGNT